MGKPQLTKFFFLPVIFALVNGCTHLPGSPINNAQQEVAKLEPHKTMSKPINNPTLVNHIYTADPSAHVFDGRLYLYPSHDLDHDNLANDNGDQYDMTDYHVLSLSEIGGEVKDHGQALHVDDVPWATKQMWAPDAAYKDGTYYFYFPARDHNNQFRIGVATSPRPEGPFSPSPSPIEGTYSIDPAVFVEEQEAYLFLGGLWGGQLEKWRNGQFDPEGSEPEDHEFALGPLMAKLSEDMQSLAHPLQEIKILDEGGSPILAGDHERRFFEGVWVHKYQGTYYLSYSTGNTHYLVYATSEHIEGPYHYRGRILEPVLGWTTHHSIVEYHDKWYLFYHDASLSGGVDNKRSVKVTELHYDENGNILPMKPHYTP